MHRPRPRRTRGRLRLRAPPSRTPRHLTCRVSVSVLLVVTWTSSDALPPAKLDPVGGARPPRCCHDVFVADGVAVSGHVLGLIALTGTWWTAPRDPGLRRARARHDRDGLAPGGLRPQLPARRRACLPGTVRRDDRCRGRLHAGVVHRLIGHRGVRSQERVLRRPELSPGRAAGKPLAGTVDALRVVHLTSELAHARGHAEDQPGRVWLPPGAVA